MKPRVLGWGSGFARHLRRGAAAYGVLAISLLLTALAWYYVHENVTEQNSVRFDDTVQATQEAIDRRTAAYVDAIFGARGLFYASDSVNAGEWSGYVGAILPKDHFKGLQSLGYVEYVRPEDRDEFSRQAAERGLPVLRPDLDPGGERPAYYPIKFVEPLDEANESLLDYDIYTEPAHRDAMNQARDTGQPAATRLTYVMTESPPGSLADLLLKPGFAVYLPVYRQGVRTETMAERRSALEGFVAGTFRMDGLLDNVFAGVSNPRIDFEVYDGRNLSASSKLYDADGVQRAGAKSGEQTYESTRHITVAGRSWTLFFSSLPGFERGSANHLPLFVLLSGLAISLLLFWVIWLLVRSRYRAERVSGDLEDSNRELESANRELEAFSYSVSHDLRAPLRTIDGFSRILQEDYGERLDAEGEDYLGRLRAASQHMGDLIDDLLDLSRVTRSPLRRESVDLSALAVKVFEEFRLSQPDRDVEFAVEGGLVARGDSNLLSAAMRNLLGNAWKFTSKISRARIEFGVDRDLSARYLAPVYRVRDNGAGFDMDYAGKLFGAFQRLHPSNEFEGTGIGLATVARIVHRHGGRVWAEGAVGEGATFYFTLSGARYNSEAPPKKMEKT